MVMLPLSLFVLYPILAFLSIPHRPRKNTPTPLYSAYTSDRILLFKIKKWDIHMVSLLLAVIYLGFVSLGLPDSLLGSAWPVIREEFGVSVSSLGVVTMLISGGTILSSLFADRLIRRIGTYFVTLASVCLTVIGLFGFSIARSFPMLLIFALPYGLGAGAIDTALNNYVALHFSSRHMNWLHCFWGVGTIVSPYIMGYCLTGASGWHGGFRTVGCIQIALLAVIAASFPLWRRPPHASETPEVPERVLTFPEKWRTPGVPLVLFAFLAYCATEATVMSWASTYLVEARHIGEVTAAKCGALFFIGMTVGRFLSGFLSPRLGDCRMIRIGEGIAAVGIVALFFPLPDLGAMAALIVIGLGCAPIYPAIIHATPSNFGADVSGSIIGLEMAFAYVGSTFMPPLYGLIAGHVTPRLLPVFLTVFFTLHIVLMFFAFRKCNSASAARSAHSAEDTE